MKDKKYWSVLNQAVRLEVTHGHLRWTVSELSRASQVSRPLIYHYFGKTKEDIVQEALKLISEEIFGLSSERLRQWQQGQISESVLATREMLNRAPFLREFYTHRRHQSSKTQTFLIDVERRYKLKFKILNKELSPEKSSALFAILFGLVMAPDVEEKSIRFAVEVVKVQILGA